MTAAVSSVSAGTLVPARKSHRGPPPFGSNLVAAVRERRIGNAQLEVLGHLVFAKYGAGLQTDFARAPQGRAGAFGASFDAGKVRFCGGQQFLAFTAPLHGQGLVAADDQSLAGVIRRDDLRHIAFVEESELQGAVVRRQGLDGRRPERRQPIEFGGRQVLLDPGRRDHTPAADERHARQAETLFQFRDLRGQGRWIARVAFKHLHRNRAAIRRAKQAEDDLQLSLLPSRL